MGWARERKKAKLEMLMCSWLGLVCGGSLGAYRKSNCTIRSGLRTLFFPPLLYQRFVDRLELKLKWEGLFPCLEENGGVLAQESDEVSIVAISLVVSVWGWRVSTVASTGHQ